MTTLVEGMRGLIDSLEKEEEAIIELISIVEGGGVYGFPTLPGLNDDLKRNRARLAKFRKRIVELENA